MFSQVKLRRTFAAGAQCSEYAIMSGTDQKFNFFANFLNNYICGRRQKLTLNNAI